jgi:GntR family transcriptional regulator
MAVDLVRDPMYRQLHQELRRRVRSGAYGSGDQFLTERSVSQEFAVSRATANKALSSLVAEGVLEFRKGVGTFVKGGTLDYDLRSLVSFTAMAEASGRRPTTRVLRQETVPADLVQAAALAVDPGAPLLHLDRLRRADGTPVILERRLVAIGLCPGLEGHDLEGSLYALWAGRYGLRIEGADQAIRAVNLPADDARALGVPAGAAALQVNATGRLEGGRPLWTERTLYRGDAYEFHGRLGRMIP